MSREVKPPVLEVGATVAVFGGYPRLAFGKVVELKKKQMKVVLDDRTWEMTIRLDDTEKYIVTLPQAKKPVMRMVALYEKSDERRRKEAVREWDEIKKALRECVAF